jgi:hypothetical protein
MQRKELARYWLVAGCALLAAEMSALLLARTKDLVAFFSWSILFALGITWLMGRIWRGIWGWPGVVRGACLVSAGGVAGIGFTFAVALVLGPWAGAFSMPVGMCWLAGGISGGIAQEASGWVRRKCGWGFAVAMSIALAMAAMGGARLVKRATEEQAVAVIWFKWEPGTEQLRVDQRLLNRRERLTVEEIGQVMAAGVSGNLRCCATGGHGGRAEKGKAAARMILILSRQVETRAGAGGDAELIEHASWRRVDLGWSWPSRRREYLVRREWVSSFVSRRSSRRKFFRPSSFMRGEVVGGGLGLGVEDGVAAADVGDEGVGLADAVAEVELVVVAGAAAGAVVFSVGECVGEDAVLHVEHGHVLVDDRFEKLWGRCG